MKDPQYIQITHELDQMEAKLIAVIDEWQSRMGTKDMIKVVSKVLMKIGIGPQAVIDVEKTLTVLGACRAVLHMIGREP